MSEVFDFTEIQATATSLINRFGESVTHRRYTVSAYDPQATPTAPTVTDATIKAYPESVGATMVDGVFARIIEKLYVSKDSIVTPQEDDRFIVDSVQYVVDEYEDFGQLIVFKLKAPT